MFYLLLTWVASPLLYLRIWLLNTKLAKRACFPLLAGLSGYAANPGGDTPCGCSHRERARREGNGYGEPLFHGLTRRFDMTVRSRPVRRILLIQTAKIGDMVCATPLFREIKLARPELHLSVLHDPLTSAILEFNPHVDEALPRRPGEFKSLWGKIRLIRLLARGRYDAVLIMNPNVSFAASALWAGIPTRLALYPDFAGRTFKLAAPLLSASLRHQAHVLLIDEYFQLLARIGITATNRHSEIFAAPGAGVKVGVLLGGANGYGDPQSQIMKQRLAITVSLSPCSLPEGERDAGSLREFHDKPLLGLAISSANKLKALSEDKLAAILNQLLAATPHTVVLIGTAGDRESSARLRGRIKHPDRVIDTCGQVELSALPALLERLSLFIGVDSGVTYMADALGVPLLLIAGPVNLAEQRPTQSRQLVLQPALPCAPCSRVFRTRSQCATGTRACIQDVSPGQVVRAALELLKPIESRA